MHGAERVLIADDVDYYRRCREVFLKPPEMPQRYNTPVKWGCPYDCGLCTDHEQHSCLTLVEICRLLQPALPDLLRRERARPPAVPHARPRSSACSTPSCATRASPTSCRSPAASRRCIRTSSRCWTLAKARPIRHLMVNTNGVRIAESEAFAERLAGVHAGLRGLPAVRLVRARRADALRGVDLRAVRSKALERLNHHGISTTLVVTLKKGLNDDEIGKIIDFALEQPCVRGVTFQPIQARRPRRRLRSRDRSPDADRSAPEHPRADDGLPARGRHPGALPSRRAGDGLRAEARRQGHAADRHDRSATC